MEKLGGKFNLSAFHDQLLQNAAMPLAIAEKTMDAWAGYAKVSAKLICSISEYNKAPSASWGLYYISIKKRHSITQVSIYTCNYLAYFFTLIIVFLLVGLSMLDVFSWLDLIFPTIFSILSTSLSPLDVILT